jgi:signal transduction histidine kinase
LTQVLVNLATNARDAMPDGGELRITVTRVPATAGGATTTTGVVRMEVRDSGVGMDEVTRLRAFEAFYTTKTGVSPSAGIGLGLSSVLLIVQRAGGTIHVDSVPGAGTTFTIDLPVVEA